MKGMCEMKSTFNRDYNDVFVAELSEWSGEDDYIYNILVDAKQGRTFLAFRPNSKISFYIQGRNMCDIEPYNDYKPTVETKYLPLMRSDKVVDGRVTEDKWKEAIGTDKYSWGKIYSEIVDKLTMLSDTKATQVSMLYRFSPLAGSDSKIVLLDIESMFSYQVENGVTKPDLRVDVVLYNLETRQLIFLEVKRFDDVKLKNNKVLQEAITRQLKSYKELIQEEKTEIIREYNKTIEAYSKVAGIQMKPIDDSKDILFGLIITEYRLYDTAKVNRTSKKIETLTGVPVLSIGNVSNVSSLTLEHKWYPKLLDNGKS